MRIYVIHGEIQVNENMIECYALIMKRRCFVVYIPCLNRVGWTNDQDDMQKLYPTLAKNKRNFPQRDINANRFESGSLEEAIEFFSENQQGDVSQRQIQENFMVLAEAIGIV